MRNIFTKQLLIDTIVNAISSLKGNDKYLLENNAKEETINHRLAHYMTNNLQELLTRYDISIDVEYDKYGDKYKVVEGIDNPIRPDILIHRRGPGNECIMVVEIKKRSTNAHDRNKVKCLLKDPRYAYWFGVCIGKINQSNPVIEFYECKDELINQSIIPL